MQIQIALVLWEHKNYNIRSSGIMWVVQRTIQRDVWYPNGLVNKKPLISNYPNNWYGKLGDGDFIEVTHSPINTGDVLNMSPFWWYNVSVGYGIFLNLGKTIAVKNKIAGIFIQCKLSEKNNKMV